MNAGLFFSLVQAAAAAAARNVGANTAMTYVMTREDVFGEILTGCRATPPPVAWENEVRHCVNQ